jgi:hypothetical protein
MKNLLKAFVLVALFAATFAKPSCLDNCGSNDETQIRINDLKLKIGNKIEEVLANPVKVDNRFKPSDKTLPKLGLIPLLISGASMLAGELIENLTRIKKIVYQSDSQ